MQKRERIKEAIFKARNGLWKVFPIILGTILTISLIFTLIPNSFYLSIFTENKFLDPIVGSLIGSISAGFPGVSYIIGGELLNQGVSLLAVIAFIVAWVTVGAIQLPAESMILGKKFAIARNLTSFGISIIVAILTVLTLGVL